MFDAHTHLNSEQLYPDRETHLDEFIQAGGTGLINIGVNHLWNQRAIAIQQSHKTDIFIGATIGLHPGETTFGNITTQEILDEEILKLRTLYFEYKKDICGIGECGIDSHFEWSSSIQALQVQLFEAQCELAREANLPIVIHSRDNFDLTYDVLKNYPDLKIYFHCRGYTPAQITILADSFSQLRIGFCGNLSYPKAQELRDSFTKALELDIPIVLETDAPYLSPQKLRGTQNAPKNVIVMHEWVEETFGVSPDIFMHHTKLLYGITTEDNASE